MMNVSTTDSLTESRLSVSLKLVMSILNNHGEVSVGDIEAIPFVESEQDVEMILNYLLRNEQVEVVQRKVSSWPIMRWERIVQKK